LTKLLPDLSSAKKPEVVNEALSAIRESDNWDAQVDALLPLVPYVSEPQRGRALVEVMLAGWWWGDYQAQARLAVPLAVLPPAYLNPAWNELLPRMAASTRAELLSGIHALTPAIVSLGGPEAAAEVFSAIQDVGRWWP
jgi:hypothetical protein